jgi:hypothetical protein
LKSRWIGCYATSMVWSTTLIPDKTQHARIESNHTGIGLVVSARTNGWPAIASSDGGAVAPSKLRRCFMRKRGWSACAATVQLVRAARAEQRERAMALVYGMDIGQQRREIEAIHWLRPHSHQGAGPRRRLRRKRGAGKKG